MNNQGKESAMGWMVIQVSESGEDSEKWLSLLRKDLPEWVKEPDVLGRLVDGEKVCFNPDAGNAWFRGISVTQPTRLDGRLDS